jgi:cell division protein FtsN
MADSRGGRTLNRDFKDVRRHAPGAPGQPFSGWGGFGLGLGLGLSAALAVHLYHRNRLPDAAEPVPAAVQAPASAAASDDGAIAGTGATAEPDLDFYDMLPKQEVEIPAGPSNARPAGAALPKGDVTLQAGSFKQAAEAEKLQAQLAQYGVDAKIQRFSLDDETWYRVRIGPIATVEELDVIRAKLAEAEVEATPVSASQMAPPP